MAEGAFITETDVPLHETLKVSGAGKTPREHLKPASARFKYDVQIEPVPRQPDTPFQEYREAYRRYNEAVEAIKVAAAAKPASPDSTPAAEPAQQPEATGSAPASKLKGLKTGGMVAVAAGKAQKEGAQRAAAQPPPVNAEGAPAAAPDENDDQAVEQS